MDLFLRVDNGSGLFSAGRTRSLPKAMFALFTLVQIRAQ